MWVFSATPRLLLTTRGSPVTRSGEGWVWLGIEQSTLITQFPFISDNELHIAYLKTRTLAYAT
jgi:hypothetical protein